MKIQSISCQQSCRSCKLVLKPGSYLPSMRSASCRGSQGKLFFRSELLKCYAEVAEEATSKTTTDQQHSSEDFAKAETPKSNEASTSATPSRIEKTMSGLDALLGVQPDVEKIKSANQAKWRAEIAPDGGEGNISPTALEKIAGAETTRVNSQVTPGSADIDAQMQKIVEKARKLAEKQAEAKKAETEGSPNTAAEDEAALRREFDVLLKTITSPVKETGGPTKAEIQKLKDTVFGPLTFWVTETRPIQEAEREGMLIRGNLRDDRDKVFTLVCSKVTELFNGRYEVFMVEDEEEGTASARSSSSAGAAPSLSSNSKARGFIEGKRVAFQIIPTAMAQPPQTNAVRRVAAVVLGLLLVVTSLQLSLASNITKLPTETLQWFANPDNLNSDQLPPGLENWDPSSYIETAIPVLAGVILVQVAHETGHRLAAGMRGVKLGPSYFIPFSQVGSFGAITPFTSIVKDYKDMWDVAAAGPLAGAMASVAMLAIGLVQSKTGADVATSATDASVAFQAASALIPVPTSLFQGSLLLGSVTRFVLGQSALQGSSVLLSPLVIAGWVGCITTALNLLPLGSLDGGRMVQAAYGRKSLSLASFFSYLGLGLGLLGSTLALPFGLYVIITQRTAEKYIRDSVSTAGQEREAATLVALLTAILVLLPLAPELAASLGVGSTNPFI